MSAQAQKFWIFEKKLSLGVVVRAQIGYSFLTKIYPTYTTLKHYQLNADKTDSLA